MFDDCTKYALEYEQTEDRLGTHKKNTGITVNAVTAQDSELSPGKQINQTALVCEHCDKPGHRARECIMPVERLPTHKIPKWYLDKLKRKQQHNSKSGKEYTWTNWWIWSTSDESTIAANCISILNIPTTSTTGLKVLPPTSKYPNTKPTTVKLSPCIARWPLCSSQTCQSY